MRIGIFGGTFNPVHAGHITVTAFLLETGRMDQIVVVPSAHPPHKPETAITPAVHRLAMTRLAFRGLPQVTVSDTEINREGPSFSIDTVRALIPTCPAARWWFIIGIDAFLEIHAWKGVADLFREIGFLVMTRPGHGRPNAADLTDTLSGYLAAAIDPAYCRDTKTGAFVHPKLQPVQPVAVPACVVSSSAIRRRLRQKKTAATWLPLAVQDYIDIKGLYL
ncbi:MAG: nicotinate (nicotinamide) nucleotide adenylyltransferase [Deltaproteobacteria bacterium]|nr:MAG: nicotinate (nicotinamide) nucleotide adenylyltransferase [Deltaproteobacteria bacterium]